MRGLVCNFEKMEKFKIICRRMTLIYRSIGTFWEKLNMFCNNLSLFMHLREQYVLQSWQIPPPPHPQLDQALKACTNPISHITKCDYFLYLIFFIGLNIVFCFAIWIICSKSLIYAHNCCTFSDLFRPISVWANDKNTLILFFSIFNNEKI